jgi:hypothetical protein
VVLSIVGLAGGLLFCWFWSSDFISNLLRFAGSNAFRFVSAVPVFLDGLESVSALRD